MLTIRLQRVGRTNQAVFRIVLAEKHRSATKKVVEVLGHYDPRTKEFGIKDPERLKYWVAQHVELSPTAHNLLVTKGLVEGKKVKAWRPKPKPAEASAEAGVSKSRTAETRRCRGQSAGSESRSRSRRAGRGSAQRRAESGPFDKLREIIVPERSRRTTLTFGPRTASVNAVLFIPPTHEARRTSCQNWSRISGLSRSVLSLSKGYYRDFSFISNT